MQPLAAARSSIFHQIEVLLEILALKPGRVPARIVGRQVVDLLERARQEPASQWTIGDEPDSQFADGRQVRLPARGSRASTPFERGIGCTWPRGGSSPALLPTARGAALCRLTSSAIAPTVSSIGVFGSTRCW